MINVLIPMCGQGTRMKCYWNGPKPLAVVEEITLLEYAVKTLNIEGHYIFVKPTYGDAEEEIFFEVLKKCSIEKFTIINHDLKTEGASETALLAKEIITDKPLIITNCDQYLDWNSQRFLDKCNKNDSDSVIVTFKSESNQHSYAKESSKAEVVEIKEKERVSNDALVGIHYWKNGKDFVRDAEEIIKNNIRFKNEYYISTAISSLISRGKIVHMHRLENEFFFPLGSIEDIKKFSDYIQTGINSESI